MLGVNPYIVDDLISVIIPAYNHGKYIEKSINSVIFQSFTNIELIIINDGSSDDTNFRINSLYDKCKEKFSNFIYVNKENEGIIKTLNLGINISNGRYLLFMASDDFLEPFAIETMYNFLHENKDYGFVVGNNNFVNENDERVYLDLNNHITLDISKAKFFTFGDQLKIRRKDIDFKSADFGSYKSLIKGNYIPNGYLVKKDKINLIGGYSISSPLEDYYLMLQLSKITKFQYLDVCLFNYRIHSNNFSKNKKKMILNTTKTIFNEKLYVFKNMYVTSFLTHFFKLLFQLIIFKILRK